ncbi:MAG: PTS sugar transporter subunit IIB [Anaerolineaceae bacterium]|nr:PTS sugar transporter subunit IIB [Anaerolineaceae bacterium]
MANKPFRILTVCGVGMGTSLLLRMMVEDVLQEMNFKAEVEASDANSAKGARVDLILTSPPLVEACTGGYAQVRVIKSFVNTEEIRQVLTEFFDEKGLIESSEKGGS